MVDQQRSRIAVVGGRGKTGSAVCAALRVRGADAVALGRAELDELSAALRGCDAVYLIAPNLHPDEPAFVARLLRAAAAAHVRRVVYHSVSAPYAPAMPHHLGKAIAEDLVRRSGLDWSILQPCAYVENLLPGLRESSPRIAVAYDPDRLFGMIGLADVGAVAAEVLLDPAQIGATCELGGPRLVSVRDVVAAAERVLGTSVELVASSPEEWAAGPGARLATREREWLQAMFAYYDDFGLPTGSLAATAILGRPPRGLDEVLAAALG
ncbi:NmrA family NAD(P)-binding protein [Brevibacterium daeguense]|uniref:NmrA family NAD(P)-binding protein n=1 Tax=Brevibacterium daeguense TaxID=909936 RepID=A0ABP8EI52_9MICO|nr:NmrA family NAD(P)-binding protein [Brevibacterium daeguense]